MKNQTIFDIGITLLVIAGFTYLGLTDESGMPIKEPNYYCESRQAKAYCFELRDYAGKLDYRCMYDEFNLRKYFSCEEGWKEIPIQISSNQPQKGDWICPKRPNDCIEI